MERRNFLKILAGAIGVSVVAPHVLAEDVEPHVVVVKESIGFEGEQRVESVTIDMSKLNSIEEILRIYR